MKRINTLRRKILTPIKCCEYHLRLSYIAESIADLKLMAADIGGNLEALSAYSGTEIIPPEEYDALEIMLRVVEVDSMIIKKEVTSLIDKVVILRYLTPCGREGSVTLKEFSEEHHWDSVIAEGILSGLRDDVDGS